MLSRSQSERFLNQNGGGICMDMLYNNLMGFLIVMGPERMKGGAEKTILILAISQTRR
jgi:hypothetical protein